MRNPDAPVLLEVDGVRAGFGATTVLHGTSYRVFDGEIACVLGLNGAGKSVSLKVVAGVVPAWAGTVRFAGEDITRLSAEARVHRGIAHVPQGRQLFPSLTVEQNLRLGAYVLRRRERNRYPEVLQRVYDLFPRLAERRDQAAGTMSGGEQAMLAVGRALMSEPRLIIVDEASAGLAPAVVGQLFDLLREVNRAGISILMVEQNVSFSLKVADSVHIMQKGRIVYEGGVADLDRGRVASLLGVGQLLGKRLEDAAAARRAEVAPPRTRRPRRTAAERAAAAAAAKAGPSKATAAKGGPAKATATKKQAAPGAKKAAPKPATAKKAASGTNGRATTGAAKPAGTRKRARPRATE